MPFTPDKKRDFSLLAVYAHPDDESFVPGGTIARDAFEGATVTLVCATKGEAGMLGEPPLADRASLGSCRQQELIGSCKVLGIDKICFLELFDSKLDTYPHPVVEGKIVEIIRRVKPQVVITFGSEGITGHPDHAAISHFTTDAFFDAGRPDRYPEFEELGLEAYQPTKLYYSALPKNIAESLSVRLHGIEEDKITAVIDVSRFSHIKRDALYCHRTQVPDFKKFNEEDLHKIFTKEYFSLAHSSLSHQMEMENDLFEGLR